jgi:uncharacterized membrane protein (UPF0182 family)
VQPRSLPRRGSRVRAVIIVAILLVLFASLGLSRFYTDVLWFREVGFSSVLFTSLSTQFFVGASVGVVVAIVVWLNLFIAHRAAPVYVPSSLEVGGRPDPMERYRGLLAPYLKWLRFAAAGFIGLLAGLGAATTWQDYLLWANRVPFGIEDPQFGKDISFYVFELPFLKDVLSWIWFAALAALMVSLAAHYFHGSIRPERGIAGVTSKALAHLSVLLGLLAVTKAGQYYLGTYDLNFSPRGTVSGASYTDVNAQLPALRLLAIISIVSAVLFLVNIFVRRISLPLAAVAIWVLTSVLAGALWPFFVQRFSVDPQELQKETPYIQRNLDATRAAFGLSLDQVDSQPFAASEDLTDEEVEANDPLLQNVRLWDPGVLQLAYSQLQAIRTYYKFPDVDVDRYMVDGEMRQVLLSARELSVDDLPEQSRTWANTHLQYTHGYGLVASLANGRTPAGQPDFLVSDVPGTAETGAEAVFPDDQPRLYYGEGFESEDFSLVDTGQDELDYPGTRSNYEGEGGISVGGIFRQLAFSIREFDPNIVLSSLITGDSSILLYRNVRDRVLRAAPFLSLDSDPYPAVIDGRVQWILDGYTTSTNYPYSERVDLGELVESNLQGALNGQANYLRNSVKIVVDAYDGDMQFYVIDESDPMIQAWRGAFPDLFTDEEPSEELVAHFRYPEDLFKVQSEMFLTYHMEEPGDFYAREDQWAIPNNPTLGETAKVAPTYLLVSLPGETDQEFVLTRPFTPRARNNMIGLMVARSDPGKYGELRLLEFPETAPPLGPTQVDNIINQDVEISQTLTLLRQGGSTVDFGSLVILPIEESILYVQPIFVIADNGGAGTGIPELKRIVIVYGENVTIGETFEDALGQQFDLAPVEPPVDPEEPDEEEPPVVGEVAELLERAGNLYDRAQAALQDGDFAEYGRLITLLGEVRAEAQHAAANH